MGSALCALFDSKRNQAWCNILLQGGLSIWVVGAHAIPCRATVSALWLQQNEALFVQEILPAKDIDLPYFKKFPMKATTLLQVGSMSLEWPLDPIAKLTRRSSSFHKEAGCSSTQPLQILQGIAGLDACGALLGTPGVSLDRFFPSRRTVNTAPNIPWEYSVTTYVKNGSEKRLRWITVSQHGKLERRVQQQAGQKAQQCEHQFRRWHTALRRSRGASQHSLSLHA